MLNFSFLAKQQQMVRTIIIDDEANAREDIRQHIEDHFKHDIVVVTECDSVLSGLEAIEKYKPDLLLLDINLSPGTGFDLIEQSTYKGYEVVFITAYDHHAIKAIKVGALDYVLKPVDAGELKEAVSNALKRLMQEVPIEKNLEELVKVSSEYFRGAQKKRVVLKTTESVFAVYEEDIYYCRSEGHYTTFYTRQLGKIVISKSIKKVQEILSEEVFVRCHQSYLVNKQYVLKYCKHGKLVINDDTEIPVSHRRKDYTLARIFN